MLKVFSVITKITAFITWIGGFIMGLVVSETGFMLTTIFWIVAFLTGSMSFTIGLIAEEVEDIGASVYRTRSMNDKNFEIVTSNQNELSNDLKYIVRIVRKLEPKE